MLRTVLIFLKGMIHTGLRYLISNVLCKKGPPRKINKNSVPFYDPTASPLAQQWRGEQGWDRGKNRPQSKMHRSCQFPSSLPSHPLLFSFFFFFLLVHGASKSSGRRNRAKTKKREEQEHNTFNDLRFGKRKMTTT